jgi:alkylated DNA repair dioxygenase AlkB
MIPGFKYIPNWIDKPEWSDLIQIIDLLGTWSSELKRRTQHYGYKYDYTKKQIDETMFIGKIPWWLKKYTLSLVHEGLFEKEPDQVIINEYNPGQGISRHIDCVPCFGNVIASLSLGSTCAMEFEHIKSSKKGSTILEPGSLLILSGEARYDWMHSIPARLEDKSGEDTLIRSRRVSLTFRTVNNDI